VRGDDERHASSKLVNWTQAEAEGKRETIHLGSSGPGSHPEEGKEARCLVGDTPPPGRSHPPLERRARKRETMDTQQERQHLVWLSKDGELHVQEGGAFIPVSEYVTDGRTLIRGSAIAPIIRVGRYTAAEMREGIQLVGMNIRER
jgi:hypothetical protein